jgi:hypothetical protein
LTRYFDGGVFLGGIFAEDVGDMGTSIDGEEFFDGIG